MRGEEVFLSVVAMVGFALLALPLVRALSERIPQRDPERLARGDR